MTEPDWNEKLKGLTLWSMDNNITINKNLCSCGHDMSNEPVYKLDVFRVRVCPVCDNLKAQLNNDKPVEYQGLSRWKQ